MSTTKQSNTEIEFGKLKIKFADKDKPLFKLGMMALIVLPISTILLVIAFTIPQSVESKTIGIVSGVGIGAYGIVRGIRLLVFKQQG